MNSLKAESWSKKVTTMPVVKSPEEIQTAAISTPKIFFLTRRCLNGRNVACVRSREIAVRLNNDAKGKKKLKAMRNTVNAIPKEGKAQKSHRIPKDQQKVITKPPTNMSATPWLITKNMLRLRRLRSFM